MYRYSMVNTLLRCVLVHAGISRVKLDKRHWLKERCRLDLIPKLLLPPPMGNLICASCRACPEIKANAFISSSLSLSLSLSLLWLCYYGLLWRKELSLNSTYFDVLCYKLCNRFTTNLNSGVWTWLHCSV